LGRRKRKNNVPKSYRLIAPHGPCSLLPVTNILAGVAVVPFVVFVVVVVVVVVVVPSTNLCHPPSIPIPSLPWRGSVAKTTKRRTDIKETC